MNGWCFGAFNLSCNHITYRFIDISCKPKTKDTEYIAAFIYRYGSWYFDLQRWPINRISRAFYDGDKYFGFGHDCF